MSPAHEADHVRRRLEPVEHPAQQALRLHRRGRRSWSARLRADARSRAPRSRRARGVHRVQPCLGRRCRPEPLAHERAEAARRPRRRPRPTLRMATPRSSVSTPPQSTTSAEQLRHPHTSRARREQRRHARRPASRRTGRRSCPPASGGTTPRAGSRASRRPASRTRRVAGVARRSRSPTGRPARPAVGSPGPAATRSPSGQRLARLRPERQQVAEVGPRVADRGHLPVDDRGDPRAKPVPGHVDDHVVQLEVPVHDAPAPTPRAGGRAASPARRRSRAARGPGRRLRRPRAGSPSRCPTQRSQLPGEVAAGTPDPGRDERLPVDAVDLGERRRAGRARARAAQRHRRARAAARAG